MATERQSAALSALSGGAFLSPIEFISGLAHEEAGEDLILVRQIICAAEPVREQRWRIAPDGSPRLLKDGRRLH